MKKPFFSEYEKLRKKYKLPEYKLLDKEFDISTIDDTANNNALKAIREAVQDKIKKMCELLEEILQPDTNISNLYESRVFDETGKKRVFDLYKQMMVIKRKSDILFMNSEEKEDAAFITETLSQWIQAKPQLLSVLTELQDSWKKEAEPTDKLVYFG